jgi:pyruvate/2-oxoglutarate/acetoin dehydrogenase E1 component
MPEMTMLQAINDALHVAMAKDDGVVMLGQSHIHI